MLHKRHRRVWFCLLALVLGTPVAVPQNNPVAEKPAARAAKPKATVTEGAQSADQRADQKQDRRVIIENADDYRYDPATKMHYLRGHVVFVTRDMRMTCEAADYNADADTMKAALRTATPEEDGFIDHVLALVEAGRLPRSLVESTFQWARRKTKNRFQYFRHGLIVRAAAEGIAI